MTSLSIRRALLLSCHQSAAAAAAVAVAVAVAVRKSMVQTTVADSAHSTLRSSYQRNSQ